MRRFTRRLISTDLVRLDFGVDGFEFAAGIVEFHLPVDGALLDADIFCPG